MRVAEILSDLTSLRACDPAAALALVSAHKSSNSATSATTNGRAAGGQDVDLQRAKDLLDLHSGVKLARRDGVDAELRAARERVRAVVEGL